MQAWAPLWADHPWPQANPPRVGVRPHSSSPQNDSGWIDVNEARVLAAKAGWGRIHVKRIPAEKALYMGKYLTKEDRAPCLKGWRLWAPFGPLKSTKVREVQFQSEFSKIIRELIATNDKVSYFKRLVLADEIYFKRLLEDAP